MAKKKTRPKGESGPATLDDLVQRAVDVAKKAKKHRKSLTGDNFYANKLVELRADATNVFRGITASTAGDVSAMAEMIEQVFSPSVPQRERVKLARELSFSLRTTWHDEQPAPKVRESDGVFPLSILAKCNRGYLVRIGRQMNGAFQVGWYDACAVMMRRILEIAIIEAFEANSIAHKIKNSDGNYLHLSDLIQRSISESTWSLSRNSKKFLPQLRDVGHMSAHGRYFHASKEDIEKVQPGIRIVVEEFLHHAHLL